MPWRAAGLVVRPVIFVADLPVAQITDPLSKQELIHQLVEILLAQPPEKFARWGQDPVKPAAWTKARSLGADAEQLLGPPHGRPGNC